jgi:hypothetical protein
LAAFILAVASTVRLAMEPATYAAGMMGLGGAKDTKREGPTKQRTTRDDDAVRIEPAVVEREGRFERSADATEGSERLSAR